MRALKTIQLTPDEIISNKATEDCQDLCEELIQIPNLSDNEKLVIDNIQIKIDDNDYNHTDDELNEWAFDLQAMLNDVQERNGEPINDNHILSDDCDVDGTWSKI